MSYRYVVCSGQGLRYDILGEDNARIGIAHSAKDAKKIVEALNKAEEEDDGKLWGVAVETKDGTEYMAVFADSAWQAEKYVQDIIEASEEDITQIVPLTQILAEQYSGLAILTTK